MPRKFAVFDIDGTIIRTALFLQVVDELITRKHLAPSLRAGLDAKLEAYQSRAHQTAFQEYNEAAVTVLFDNLRGLHLADYRAAVDTVVARNLNHVYVYTRQLIAQLKQEDYFLIALSGSEQHAVEQFMEQFGFDAVQGDEYAVRDGMFTGEVNNSVFHGKGKALQHIITENKLAKAGSWAIGDSASDASMLELADNPIAFNPEAKLLELAKAKGWQVVIERKNVIYRLEPAHGTYVLAETN